MLRSSATGFGSSAMATFVLLMLLLAAPIYAAPHFVVGRAVNTTSGRVEGRPSDLRPLVSTYLGIPYAQPPVDSLRFAAPVTAKYANFTIQADALVSSC